MNYKYLFGPVPSRRLGISLGVDLVPLKVCSLDCIYCECGKTTTLTLERKEYVPFKDVVTELDDYLKKSPELDYITFSGSGEPTLHSKIGEIVNHIKKNYSSYKIALLTNSTLLGNKTLQDELKEIDLIIPSLDAVTQETFDKINRPISSLKIDKYIEDIIDFSNNYKGKIWVEIFIVPGINNSKDELNEFKKILTKINPERIQLNSIDRPGTEEWIKKSKEDELIKIKDSLAPLPVEIVAKFNSATKTYFEHENMQEKILSIIKRRPCTIDDLVNISGANILEVKKNVNLLIDSGKIKTSHQNRGEFFIVKK